MEKNKERIKSFMNFLEPAEVSQEFLLTVFSISLVYLTHFYLAFKNIFTFHC